MPAASSSEIGEIVLVGISARALAAAARRAGFRPLAFDLFADTDTRDIAQLCVEVRQTGGLAIDAADLKRKLAGHVLPGTPIVLGAGFEARPDLVGDLAARYRLIGNDARTIAKLKDPFVFAQMLRRLNIAHPPVYAHRPAAPARPLLAKRRGAAGGAHIRAPGRHLPPGWYLQEHVDGRAISALFLAGGGRLAMLGFSEQWTAPTPASPFRYGGAVGPVALAPRLASAIERALARLAGAMGLVGLNSADLIVTHNGFQLIEINPRPGATLDVFDADPLPPLMKLHVEAGAGVPTRLPRLSRARAAGILYASRPITAPAWDWPDWTSDRPRPGTWISIDAPVCTVHGEADTAPAARALVERRMSRLRQGLGLDGGGRPEIAA